MTGYKRFVAYVYEYNKDKKGENRGFVKVESKGGQCKIDIQLRYPGLTADIPCKVFAFIREKNRLKGILLWETRTVRDGVKSSREFKGEILGRENYRLEDFSGMVILLEEGGFYGTEWDDLPIDPGVFEEESQTQKKVKEQKMMESKPREELLLEQGNILQDDIEETKEKISLTGERGGREEIVQEEVVQEEEVQEEEVQKEEVQEEEIKEKEMGEEVNPEERVQKGEVQVEAAQVCQKEAEDSREYPVFMDGEIINCRKIEPREFSCLNRRDWPLRNNRFLQYGYYNFGYLIIGRMRESGKYILGVPGAYDQQERFMANMFGFPHFKISKTVQVPEGKGGYWYRLIHTPDGSVGNGK